ncbi:hypothetical protein C8J57DRAFT_1282250 [Mycena rebaudengoi]|nr:hypothetical protein C8J57DRAFT_1282250 [Mycena rebaudengoi]
MFPLGPEFVTLRALHYKRRQICVHHRVLSWYLVLTVLTIPTTHCVPTPGRPTWCTLIYVCLPLSSPVDTVCRAHVGAGWASLDYIRATSGYSM